MFIDPIVAMREGMTSGMMIPFSMLRKSSPMYFTYIASLLVQGSSLEDLSPSPSPIPEREIIIIIIIKVMLGLYLETPPSLCLHLSVREILSV